MQNSLLILGPILLLINGVIYIVTSVIDIINEKDSKDNMQP